MRVVIAGRNWSSDTAAACDIEAMNSSVAATNCFDSPNVVFNA